MFANQDYAVGDVIEEEASPIVSLAPSSKSDSAKLFAALPAGRKGAPKQDDDGQASFTSTIVPPASVPKDYIGKFLGMVQALSSSTELVEQNDDNRTKLLELYSPDTAPSREEEGIVKVAQEALKYIQNHSKGGSNLRKLVTDDAETALKIMLVWSCNSFQGGRIYEKQSRINHSCNPNAIIQVVDDDDKQIVRAATAIANGEEITISYLGLLLYSDRPTRQSQLVLHKHFSCTCNRCSASPDPAAAVPCSQCHAREGRYLEEDVAFDDDKQVHYMFPRAASAPFECTYCDTKLESKDKKNGPIALVESVSQKVLSHLQDQEIQSNDDDVVDEEWEDQLYQLACQVAGTLHWTTNLVSLMRLNRHLKQHHASMLQTGENPEMEDIAEAIDSLERLCRFVNGLDLSLHMGHLLSNIVVGVARTLVSLGDDKSKKYGAEWVTKIQEYADVFESEGMKKVVASLLEAGERGIDEPAKKKSKT